MRSALGYPVTAEDMAARPDVGDTWAVIAQTVEVQDRLTARATWLVGRSTGMLAQVLDHGTAGAPLPPAPLAGQDFTGALAFHPGDPALRAVFRDGRSGPAAETAVRARETVAAAATPLAAVLARAPWTERWPVRLAGVRLGRLSDADAFGVGDGTGCLALRADPRLPSLLAVAAGARWTCSASTTATASCPSPSWRRAHLYTAPTQAPQTLLARVPDGAEFDHAGRGRLGADAGRGPPRGGARPRPPHRTS